MSESHIDEACENIDAALQTVTFDPPPESDADELPAHPPHRILLGETAEGDLIVAVTEAGREAQLSEGIPVECAFCRVTFARGDGYYRLNLGMDETASTAGGKPTEGCLVESVDELTVCTRCEPVISREFDRFLELLWALRAPDPEIAAAGFDTAREPYEDEGDVTETVALPP